MRGYRHADLLPCRFIACHAGLLPSGFIAMQIYRQWQWNSPIGINWEWICLGVDVLSFVRKRCKVETEVSRRWAVAIEKVANLRRGGSEVVYFRTFSGLDRDGSDRPRATQSMAAAVDHIACRSWKSSNVMMHSGRCINCKVECNSCRQYRPSLRAYRDLPDTDTDPCYICRHSYLNDDGDRYCLDRMLGQLTSPGTIMKIMTCQICTVA